MAGKKLQQKRPGTSNNKDMKNLARLKEVTRELSKRAPVSEKLFQEKFSLMKKLGITFKDD